MFLFHQIVTLSFHYFVCIQCYRCTGDPNEGNCTDQVRTIEWSLDKNLEYQDSFVNTITVRSYKHLTSDQWRNLVFQQHAVGTWRAAWSAWPEEEVVRWWEILKILIEIVRWWHQNGEIYKDIVLFSLLINLNYLTFFSSQETAQSQVTSVAKVVRWTLWKLQIQMLWKRNVNQSCFAFVFSPNIPCNQSLKKESDVAKFYLRPSNASARPTSATRTLKQQRRLSPPLPNRPPRRLRVIMMMIYIITKCLSVCNEKSSLPPWSVL